jgi:DnaJ-class molecular chaperone
MTYKVICDNCAGNGYLNIKDNKGETEVKQCWTCESEGELTYDEKDVKKISDRLCDTYHHKQLH